MVDEEPARPGDVELPRVDLEPGGPVIVPGPVEVCVAGSEPVVVDRFRVALCACGRSGRYPLCDSSHRLLDRAKQ